MDSVEVVPPSALFPVVEKFLVENSLKKSAKAFRKETNTNVEGRSAALRLMDIYAGYTAFKLGPKKLKKQKAESRKRKREENEEDAAEVAAAAAERKEKRKQKNKEKKLKQKAKKAKLKAEGDGTEKEKEEKERKEKEEKERKEKEEKERKEKEEKERKELKEKEAKKEKEGKKEKTPKKKKKKKSKKSKGDDAEKMDVDAEEKGGEENGSSAAEAGTQANGATNGLAENGKAAKTTKPFKRVDDSSILPQLNPELRDNSYEALRKRGDGWGDRANQILGAVKGKGFRHEKTKKKRGTYRGGSIDASRVNSIRFDD